MLNIQFGDMPEAVYETATYFRNVWAEKWITDPLSKEMILDVDHSEVIDAHTIYSPAFGKTIPPTELSGGVKTLILIANDHSNVFNASKCGDNCAKWILKIADIQAAKKQKTVINLRHLMDFGNGTFKIRIMNTNRIVTTMQELLLEAGELV